MAEGNKVGRPLKIDDALVSKLEEGFLQGLNDTECCLYAGISRTCFYEYLQKHPEFADRKEALKNRPSIKAKQNIVTAIDNGDEELSRWWLERKNKQEFSTKQEIAADVKEDLTITIELTDE